MKPRRRVSFGQARARAAAVQLLRAQGFEHKEIAVRLRLKRDLVAYYCSSRCKHRPQ